MGKHTNSLMGGGGVIEEEVVGNCTSLFKLTNISPEVFHDWNVRVLIIQNVIHKVICVY